MSMNVERTRGCELPLFFLCWGGGIDSISNIGYYLHKIEIGGYKNGKERIGVCNRNTG